jgi:hypothetical protein
VSRVQRWAKQVVDGERLVVPALVAFSLVGGLSLAVGETAIDTDVVGGLVGVATFLFGVLVAFATNCSSGATRSCWPSTASWPCSATWNASGCGSCSMPT